MTTLTLPARQPFDLTAVIRSHGWVQLAPFDSADPYNWLGYVDELPSGRVVAWQVRPAPGGVTAVTDADLNPTEKAELAARIGWMLGLDQDLLPFYEVVRGEPRLAHVETGAHGRILRSPTLFEDTVRTILTTNTAWGGTRRMAAALVDLYGAPLPGDETQRAFPTPARLAAVPAEELRDAAKLGYRAPYVSALARRVAAGDLDLEAYKESGLTTDDLRRELLTMKGVGPYAAAHLLLLLGRSDDIPKDTYARDMVSKAFHDGEPVGKKEIDAAFADWGTWKGLVFWFWDYDSSTN